ncbi:MAG TPA: cell division protein SepF [Pseudonocardiaceae bacterium]|jgi:cell division inhibitor SepF|nr:cell division protein SepF [Pseudonocardiaceae bacterium]
MSALQKLRAYFGMVPADELDDYEDERYGDYGSGYAEDDQFDGYGDRAGGRFGARSRPLAAARPVSPDYESDERPRGRRPWQAEPPVRRTTPTHGALAMESAPEPLVRSRPTVEPASSPNKITTLHPRSYIEARTIGEHYRDGHPVIMNLTEMSDADAKRLVDFAAGLAFAMRGSMDKVTNKVFLISPPNVDVPADQRRRLAEGGSPG